MSAKGGRDLPRATMARSGLEASLTGIGLQPGAGQATLAAVLAQDPEVLTRRALVLTGIAQDLLPTFALSPPEKAAHGREDHPLLSTQAFYVAEALRLLSPLGLVFSAAPEQVEELLRQRGACAAIELLGKQLSDDLMDQRAVVGGFLCYLLDRVLAALDERRQDPFVPAAEREQLLGSFAPVLLALDELLRHPVERKETLAAQRQALGAQLAEARADAEAAETLLRLREGIRVPREDLFAAALRQKERRPPSVPADREALPAGPAKPPLPPGPRIV